MVQGSSLEASTHAYRTQKVNPGIVPLWNQCRIPNGTYFRRPAMFYLDRARGWLLHARLRRNQAHPSNAAGSDYRRLPHLPPLEPDRCTGKWYLVDNSVVEDIRSIESDMYSLWERIEFKKELSPEEGATAFYLRHLFDHFLWWLAASARKRKATFDTPLPLASVEEPHMKNAIANRRQGRPYSEGAWIFSQTDPRCSPKPGGKRKRTLPDGCPNDDNLDTEYRPRIKKTRIRIPRAASSPEQQQGGASGAVHNPNQTPDAAANQQTTHSTGDYFDSDLTDIESAFSDASSKSIGEEDDDDRDDEEEAADADDEDEGAAAPIEKPPTPAPDPTSSSTSAPPRPKRLQFLTMFDMAVPFLEKMLDDMPVSPEDLKAYPDLAEKRSALIHWDQNKEQALLLLRAMHKAYLNVMVGSETETRFGLNPLQQTPLASENSDRERTLLATDRTPSPELDTGDEPPVSQILDEQVPYQEPKASVSPTRDFIPVEETQKPGPDLEIEASHGLVILPNNFPPKGSDDRKRTLADRSASLLESGTTDVPLASRILDEPTAPHEGEPSLSTTPPMPKIPTTATRALTCAPPKKVEVKPEKGKAKAEPWTRGTTRRGKDDGFWTAYGYDY